MPLLLAAVIAAGCRSPVDVGESGQGEQGDSTVTASVSAQSTGLAQPEDLLPQNLYTGEKPPTTDLEDTEGNPVSLDELYQGQPVWLLFFASWCPDCDSQLDHAKKMQEIANENGVRLVYVDRLNPEKESVDAAEQKLTEKGAAWSASPMEETGKADLLIDPEERLYKAWGIQEIPTSVFLNADGLVTAMKNKEMTEGECEGFLEKGLRGADVLTKAFVQKALTTTTSDEVKTGIRTGTSDSRDVPSGSDVLSESQGLMMTYDVMTGDMDDFAKVWTFTKEQMMEDGLPAWYVTKDGERADTNSFLDDIRIWNALHMAGQDYREDADALLSAIEEKCLTQNGPVNYVKPKHLLSGAEQADEISLCYLDLSIMQEMAKEDSRFQNACQSAEKILDGGYLGDDFPLYAASYSYKDKAYSKDDLNTAEALYTLWNLAKAGKLPDAALVWLRKNVKAGTLYARYTVSGQPADGYTWFSTAVYGLAALIGEEAGDKDLEEQAVRKMERYLILDADDEQYGAFCAEGSDASAFDQLIPMIVYANRAMADSTEEKA